MKKISTIVTIFLIVKVLCAHQYLISVEQLPQTKWSTVTVIEVIYDTYLIHADEKNLKDLCSNGIKYTILDRDPLKGDEQYYIVYPHSESKSEIIKTAHILYEQMNFLIVRVENKNEISFMDLRVDRDHISFDPYVFTSNTVDKNHIPHIPYEEEIETIIKETSKDSLRSYVKKMERFKTRKANQNQSTIDWLMQKFKELGADSVFTEDIPKYKKNVIGMIKGTEHQKGKYCLISGHFDAVKKGPIAAGADDNASGTAAALEACRVMKKFSFKHTILFATFDAEEVGLKGSAVFAKNAKKRNDIIIGGCINFDLIGYSKETPILWIHYKKSVSGNEELAITFERCAKKYIPDLKVSLTSNSDMMYRSDQVSFWNNGYAAIMGMETKMDKGLCPNYHKIGDTLDDPKGLNNSDLMTNSTKAGIAALAYYAEPNPITKNNNKPPINANDHFTIKYNNSFGGISIRFTITQSSAPIKIHVFNLFGARITQISNREFMKGTHSISLPTLLPTRGLYIIEFHSGTRVISKKILKL